MQRINSKCCIILSKGMAAIILEPQDPEEFWCVDCCSSHESQCPYKGSVPLIQDSQVQTRAVASLPKGLQVQDVDGIRQIVANMSIAVRTRFGPLQGIEMTSEDVRKLGMQDEEFTYKLFRQNEAPTLLMTSDENHTNWMSLVNLATKEAEQNLVSYHYQNSIYFSAIRKIHPGDILKVYFSPPYAQKLDRSILRRGHRLVLENEAHTATTQNEKAGGALSKEAATETECMRTQWACGGENCGTNFESTNQSDDQMKFGGNEKDELNDPKTSFDEPDDHSSTPGALQLAVTDSGKEGVIAETIGCTSSNHNTHPDKCSTEIMKNSNKDFSNNKNKMSVCMEKSKLKTLLETDQICHETSDDPLVLPSCHPLDGRLKTLDGCSDHEQVFSNKEIHQKTETKSDVSCSSVSSDHEVDSEQGDTCPFKCLFCDATFFYADHLKTHMIESHMHRGRDSKRCYVCCKSFATNSTLQQHQMQHENMQSATCHVCAKHFMKEDMDRHLKDTHNVDSFICVLCDAKKSTFSAMQHHLLDHKSKNQFPQSILLKRKCQGAKTRRKETLSRICGVNDESKKRRNKRQRKQTVEREGVQQRVSKEEKIDKTSKEGRKTEMEFTCAVCRMQYTSHHLYMEHMGVHISKGQADVPPGSEPLTCEICFKKFYSRLSLQRHKTSSHKPKNKKCANCDFKAMTDKTLMEHILSVHPEVDLGIPEEFCYKCLNCGKVFLEMSRLNKHMNTHRENRYTCDVCSRTFSRSESLKYHKCKKRPRIGTTSGYKEGHQKVRADMDGLYSCPDCPSRFESQKSLAQHLFTHQKGEHSCELCHMKFVLPENLRLHKYIHFKMLVNEEGYSFLVPAPLKDKLLFTCLFCSTQIKRYEAVPRHAHTQHNKDLYPCCICCMVFVTRSDLLKHFNDHKHLEVTLGSLLDVHGCDICFSVFYGKKALMNHKRKTHGSRRENICPCCGKLFKRKDVLDVHIKIHLKQEKTKCMLCGRKVHDLKKHKLLHSSESQFACGECDRGFAHESYLQQHMKCHSVPGRDVYECNVCSSKFDSYHKLYNHKRRVNHRNSISMVTSMEPAQRPGKNTTPAHLTNTHDVESYAEFTSDISFQSFPCDLQSQRSNTLVVNEELHPRGNQELDVSKIQSENLMKIIRVVMGDQDKAEDISDAVVSEILSSDINQIKVVIQQHVGCNTNIVEVITEAIVNSNSDKNVVIEVV